jgi:DNA transposition AAA+ family ATPase
MTANTFARGSFIDTRTARHMIAFVEKVRRASRCGWIVGASGVGKTAVINHLVRENEGCAKVITALKTNGTLKPFLTTLGQVFGCNAIGNSAKAIYDKLEDFVTPDSWGEYNRLLECNLLFVDEAQHVDLHTVRVVLELQKNSGIPIVFLSNEERLERSRAHDPALKQIANRIPFRLDIKTVHPEDIRAFGIAYNLEGTEPITTLNSLASSATFTR